MLLGGRDQVEGSPELSSSLLFLACTSFQATPLFFPLAHTNAEFKTPLWSLQGQAGICQVAHRGGPWRHISLSISSYMGCPVSYTTGLCFPFFTGRNCLWLHTLDIKYMVPASRSVGGK